MGWFREFLRGGEGTSDQMRAKREQKGEGIVQGTEKSKKVKALSLGLEEIKGKRGRHGSDRR
jgi:hypothetical protein